MKRLDNFQEKLKLSLDQVNTCIYPFIYIYKYTTISKGDHKFGLSLHSRYTHNQSPDNIRGVGEIMATGSGGGSYRARVAGVRKVYEEFMPVSEWQQDDESHILVIDLPGFTKEQIKVSTEGQNVIRVRGERLVAGNKWARFQKDSLVPENCDMNSVRAKHQGGSLAVTVQKQKPKKTITPQKIQEAISPKTTSIDSKGQDKVLSDLSPRIKTSQLVDDKTTIPQMELDEQRVRNSITPLRNAQHIAPPAVGERKESSEVKEMPNASQKQEMTPETTVKNGMNDLEKSKYLPAAEIGKKLENNEAASASENEEAKEKQIIQSRVADHGAFKMHNYKKAMKGLSELNEERQLLANMGVAVLVIMLLSAYVTYNFTSGKAKN